MMIIMNEIKCYYCGETISFAYVETYLVTAVAHCQKCNKRMVIE